MRLSLKDFIFSNGTSSGYLKRDYSNYQFNNRFLSTDYFHSKTFENDLKNNYWRNFVKDYYEKNVKNVIVKVDSNYLLSQKNEDGIITLEFENVDGQGVRVNTYKVELLFSIFQNYDKKNYASFEWINITSDKPNDSIKYDVEMLNIGTYTDLTEFTLEEEVIYKNEEDYNKYDSAFSYDEYYNNNRKKVSFENIIFAFKTPLLNTRFYDINLDKAIITIKAKGALATDTIKIYLKDITDFKKYYRQGCVYSDNSFKGLNKIDKKIYIGTREILEDEINNSEKVDTGHVRLFKDTNYKQAKYIESDNV
nr:MAG TPA: hypothetical protein [Caudoviricetes sp.]